ncbi:MAG: sodium ion-translocating decarboxylase subunit beta, partial [Alcanivorax sp.]
PQAPPVADKVGRGPQPHHLPLMPAMGPNVAGVIGSAVAAGVLPNFAG